MEECKYHAVQLSPDDLNFALVPDLWILSWVSDRDAVVRYPSEKDHDVVTKQLQKGKRNHNEWMVYHDALVKFSSRSFNKVFVWIQLSNGGDDYPTMAAGGIRYMRPSKKHKKDHLAKRKKCSYVSVTSKSEDKISEWKDLIIKKQSYTIPLEDAKKIKENKSRRRTHKMKRGSEHNNDDFTGNNRSLPMICLNSTDDDMNESDENKLNNTKSKQVKENPLHEKPTVVFQRHGNEWKVTNKTYIDLATNDTSENEVEEKNERTTELNDMSTFSATTVKKEEFHSEMPPKSPILSPILGTFSATTVKNEEFHSEMPPESPISSPILVSFSATTVKKEEFYSEMPLESPISSPISPDIIKIEWEETESELIVKEELEEISEIDFKNDTRHIPVIPLIDQNNVKFSSKLDDVQLTTLVDNLKQEILKPSEDQSIISNKARNYSVDSSIKKEEINETHSSKHLSSNISSTGKYRIKIEFLDEDYETNFLISSKIDTPNVSENISTQNNSDNNIPVKLNDTDGIPETLVTPKSDIKSENYSKTEQRERKEYEEENLTDKPAHGDILSDLRDFSNETKIAILNQAKSIAHKIVQAAIQQSSDLSLIPSPLLCQSDNSQKLPIKKRKYTKKSDDIQNDTSSKKIPKRITKRPRNSKSNTSDCLNLPASVKNNIQHNASSDKQMDAPTGYNSYPSNQFSDLHASQQAANILPLSDNAHNQYSKPEDNNCNAQHSNGNLQLSMPKVSTTKKDGYENAVNSESLNVIKAYNITPPSSYEMPPKVGPNQNENWIHKVSHLSNGTDNRITQNASFQNVSNVSPTNSYGDYIIPPSYGNIQESELARYLTDGKVILPHNTRQNPIYTDNNLSMTFKNNNISSDSSQFTRQGNYKDVFNRTEQYMHPSDPSNVPIRSPAYDIHNNPHGNSPHQFHQVYQPVNFLAAQQKQLKSQNYQNAKSSVNNTRVRFPDVVLPTSYQPQHSNSENSITETQQNNNNIVPSNVPNSSSPMNNLNQYCKQFGTVNSTSLPKNYVVKNIWANNLYLGEPPYQNQMHTYSNDVNSAQVCRSEYPGPPNVTIGDEPINYHVSKSPSQQEYHNYSNSDRFNAPNMTHAPYLPLGQQNENGTATKNCGSNNQITYDERIAAQQLLNYYFALQEEHRSSVHNM